MSKIEDVRAAMMQAMKDKDKERKESLSMLLSALKNKAIDKRADLTDEEENAIVLKEIKQCQEAIDTAPAGRDEVIAENTARIAVYQAFAPKMMDAAEIEAVLTQVLSELNIAAPTAKEKGLIMKTLMPRVKGKADSGLVNQVLTSRMQRGEKMNIREESLQKHYDWKGKIEVVSRAPINTREDLSLAYTPGVAEPCLVIQKDVDKSYELTRRANLVAVVTDGTAVLGLGDIGPEAGMPVMEGKCALFKAFADVDAFPLCIRSKDVDEIVRTVSLLAGSFGGINLEDIAAPRCFEIERRLKEVCDIPVFHDDQHGTAIVVAAALLNALKVTGRALDTCRVVLNGAGSAGIAIGNHLLNLGVKHLTLCDRFGIIDEGMAELNPAQAEIARKTNREHLRGVLADAVKGADVFIGVSAPGVLKPEMVASMAQDPIVFAMANPTPEIMPDEAKAAGAKVVGTGRSDYPNQINNVLAFPGIFRGALDCRARAITEDMKMATSYALAALVPDDQLSAEFILPDPLDKRVAQAVAQAVMDSARKTGVARI